MVSRHRMVSPVGRVVSCGDNAALESFFRSLQKNVPNRHSRVIREGAQRRGTALARDQDWPVLPSASPTTSPGPSGTARIRYRHGQELGTRGPNKNWRPLLPQTRLGLAG